MDAMLDAMRRFPLRIAGEGPSPTIDLWFEVTTPQLEALKASADSQRAPAVLAFAASFESVRTLIGTFSPAPLVSGGALSPVGEEVDAMSRLWFKVHSEFRDICPPSS